MIYQKITNLGEYDWLMCFLRMVRLSHYTSWWSHQLTRNLVTLSPSLFLTNECVVWKLTLPLRPSLLYFHSHYSTRYYLLLSFYMHTHVWTSPILFPDKILTHCIAAKKISSWHHKKWSLNTPYTRDLYNDP